MCVKHLSRSYHIQDFPYPTWSKTENKRENINSLLLRSSCWACVMERKSILKLWQGCVMRSRGDVSLRMRILFGLVRQYIFKSVLLVRWHDVKIQARSDVSGTWTGLPDGRRRHNLAKTLFQPKIIIIMQTTIDVLPTCVWNIYHTLTIYPIPPLIHNGLKHKIKDKLLIPYYCDPPGECVLWKGTVYSTFGNRKDWSIQRLRNLILMWRV